MSLPERWKGRPCGTPRIELTRFFAGELHGEQARVLDEHVASCAACGVVLSELREAQAAMSTATDPVQVSSVLLGRAEAPERSMGFRSWGVLALGASLALALFFFRPSTPYVGVKGMASADRNPVHGPVELQVFAKTADGISQVQDGVTLKEGDAIQLRYRAGGYRHLVVVSIDGRARVTPLYPAQREGRSLPITMEGLGTLDGSIILDDAVGTERVIGLFSEEPLRVLDVLERLEGAGGQGDLQRAFQGLEARWVVRRIEKVPR